METYQGTEREAIPFLPPTDKSKTSFIEVKYIISDSTFKTQLTVFKGGSVEKFLRLIYEFEHAKSKLGYNTYQKLESGLEQLLQGTAKDEWSIIKGTFQPGTRIVQSFRARIKAFCLIYIPEPAAIDKQKSCLQIIKKNNKLSVPCFLDRLKQINLLIDQFPNSNQDNCFNEDELKRLFYFAMPLHWHINFINNGQSLHNGTTETQKIYMVHQEYQTDAHRRKTKEVNKRNNGEGNKRYNHQHSRNYSASSSKDNRTNNSHTDNNNKKRKRLTNEDDCPIHGAVHKWDQYHQNQYGYNFGPHRTAPSKSSHHTSTSSY